MLYGPPGLAPLSGPRQLGRSFGEFNQSGVLRARKPAQVELGDLGVAGGAGSDSRASTVAWLRSSALPVVTELHARQVWAPKTCPLCSSVTAGRLREPREVRGVGGGPQLPWMAHLRRAFG